MLCVLLLPSLVSGVDMVLSSLLVMSPDSQRQKFMVPNLATIQAFYETVNFYRMGSVILHDGLPEEFVEKYSRGHVRFQTVPRVLHDPIADRWLMYNEFLNGNQRVEYVLFSDADVFFQQNVFTFIRQLPEVDIFLSFDVGTHADNAWMQHVNRACKQTPPNRRQRIWNAGFWAARAEIARYLLRCMIDEFRRFFHAKDHCDMAVFNTCVSRLSAERTGVKIYEGNRWSNPFRQECDNTNYVGIHNKCGDFDESQRLLCVEFVNDKPRRITCDKTI